MMTFDEAMKLPADAFGKAKHAAATSNDYKQLEMLNRVETSRHIAALENIAHSLLHLVAIFTGRP